MNAIQRAAWMAVGLLGCLASMPLVSFAQQLPSAQNTPDLEKRCTLAGIVTSLGSNEPIRKARVVLTNDDDSTSDPYVTTTDAEGRFTISGILPTRYNLYVEHDGYLPKSYGEDESGNSEAVLHLKAGQQITDLIFRLQRCGVISGRVTDEDGDPAQGVQVEALWQKTRRGKVISGSVRRVGTNDLGEYRLFSLRPGRYVLKAFPEKEGGRIIGRVFLENSTLVSAGGYVPTYYPSVAEFSQASIIEVKAGDEVPNVDISLVRKRSYKVRGQVSNASPDIHTGWINVRLVPRDVANPSFEEMRGAVTSQSGAFEIDDVLPGSYTVFASYREDQIQFTGSAPVVVTSGDIDSVRITISRGADVRGRVILEGQIAATTRVEVMLDPIDSDVAANSQGAQTGRDGTFLLGGLHDGAYQIQAFSECGSCYLKSATAGGADILKSGLQISSGSVPSPLELVYSAHSGLVDGAVVRDDGLPAAGATVVLIAEDPPRGRRVYNPENSTDQYGHFVIKGVRPGRYRAVAYQSLQNDDYTDPEYLMQIESKADSFSLSEDEKKTLQLSLLPASDGR